MPEDLYFNGVNGSSGEYLLTPMSAAAVAAIAKGERLDERHLKELELWHERLSGESLAPTAGGDPRKIEETGWGVIFAHDAEDELRDSLRTLLDFRKEQSMKNGDFFREFAGPDGYRPGESKLDFIARHGAGPGPADPNKVPYYLLIVGDPNEIPFRFQYQLDVQYAVGRLWFDGPDAYSQYAQYAQSVVAAETGKVKRPRKAVFFGVQNRDDRATKMSAEELVTPLADELPKLLDPEKPAWSVDKVLADAATKDRLTRLFGGEETPALLFSASHGVGFRNGDPRQIRHQGALLCQDWPGPVAWRRSLPEDHYFSADDISDDASVLGMIGFHFACYGAGTPKMDDFAHQALRTPVEIAPHAFVAKLPQRLLGHPKGSALAVIGHVERAWGYSFVWHRVGRHLQAFQSTLKQLMDGYPVGFSVEYFNERYAELSTDLSATLEDVKFGESVDDKEVAGMWTANNDARSYVVLGDPAVRLPLGAGQ